MVFILGTGKLSYDYFGEWTRNVNLTIAAPEVIAGDAAQPGSATPGNLQPGGQYTVGKVDAGVE